MFLDETILIHQAVVRRLLEFFELDTGDEDEFVVN